MQKNKHQRAADLGVLLCSLELLIPAQPLPSPGSLNSGAFSEQVKASLFYKPQWETSVLGLQVKLLRVVTRP